jgi:hypothetical protein
VCSLARAGTRPAARRGNGWRLRRRMVSGRRRPIGRPRASRPRSGDLAPRRRRGCSVTSCRPRAYVAIARGHPRHGGKAKSERGPLTASACQRPKSKGGTPSSLPQSAPARSRDLAVFFSILRRYVTRSAAASGRRENGKVTGRDGRSGRIEYDIEALARSRRNEIARE